MILKIILCGVCSYLLGCINAAYIYSTKIKKTDIRSYGSGNAGSTNVLRVFGVSPAVIVFCWDMLKGFIAVTLTGLVTQANPYALFISSVGVIMGHNWPVFLDYRGGKGVASSVGIILALDWRVALICLSVGVTLIFITKMVSVGSVSGIALTPVVSLILKLSANKVIICCMLAVFCVYQHRGNIKRILNGTENKLTPKEKK